MNPVQFDGAGRLETPAVACGPFSLSAATVRTPGWTGCGARLAGIRAAARCRPVLPDPSSRRSVRPDVWRGQERHAVETNVCRWPFRVAPAVPRTRPAPVTVQR